MNWFFCFSWDWVPPCSLFCSGSVFVDQAGLKLPPPLECWVWSVCHCVQLSELNFEFLILHFKKVLGKPFLQPTSISTSDVYQKLKRNVGNYLSSGVTPVLDWVGLVGWVLAPLECPAGHFLFQKLECFAKSGQACYLTLRLWIVNTFSRCLLHNTAGKYPRLQCFQIHCFVGTSDNRLCLWSFTCVLQFCANVCVKWVSVTYWLK